MARRALDIFMKIWKCFYPAQIEYESTNLGDYYPKTLSLSGNSHQRRIQRRELIKLRGALPSQNAEKAKAASAK